MTVLMAVSVIPIFVFGCLISDIALTVDGKQPPTKAHFKVQKSLHNHLTAAECNQIVHVLDKIVFSI